MCHNNNSCLTQVYGQFIVLRQDQIPQKVLIWTQCTRQHLKIINTILFMSQKMLSLNQVNILSHEDRSCNTIQKRNDICKKMTNSRLWEICCKIHLQASIADQSVPVAGTIKSVHFASEKGQLTQIQLSGITHKLETLCSVT